MSADIATFRIRFPEFSDDTTYPDARIQLFIDDAALCIDEDRYGNMYDLAICYLAAHKLYLGTQTASSSANAQKIGPIASKSAGQVSVSRAVNSLDLSDGDSYYLQTLYGQEFLTIRNKVKIPGFMVVGKKS